MLCENCGENKANVKYTQIINGVKKQMNLCDKCANSLGINSINFNMPSIDFSNFLGGMFDNEIEDFIPSLIKPQTLLCEKCNSSYDDFINSSKFGCDECYNSFESQIDGLLKKIHGVNRHVGRESKALNNKKIQEKITEKSKAKKQTEKDKLDELKEKLKQEIKEEHYEDAAITRDEIKKIENKLKGE